MDDYDCHGWLYGTKGRKKGRPNDLGYRIGYEICRSYYDKAVNKQEAIRDILNVKDFKGFLEKAVILSHIWITKPLILLNLLLIPGVLMARVRTQLRRNTKARSDTKYIKKQRRPGGYLHKEKQKECKRMIMNPEAVYKLIFKT